MVPRALCVVFLTCQLVWMCYGSPTYGGGNANGHVGKKGSERRYQDYYDRSRTSKRTCPDSFETKANYIIRTKESLENDATFIDAIKVATSNRCIERCCDAQDVVDDDGDTVTCDAAVFVDGDDAFENKESNCFLFQCRFDTGERFRCKFSDHDSYISGMVGGFGVEPYFADSETEEEEEEEEQIPQTKAVPSTTQGKGNDPKTTEVQEEEECNSNQFQCDNGECIRLTLLCDEYKDCQDNSDESEERCTAINGHVTPTNNGNGSESAHMRPTNPPKSQTTNTNQQRPEPSMSGLPDPKEDDTIFSELARQLHKEGAKQKMQGKSNSGAVDGQHDSRGKPDELDRHDGRHPSSEDEVDYLPQPKQDEKYEDDDEQWRPRQKGRGRPYGDYDRLRPQDRYDEDKISEEREDYRDYPKRPLDDARDDTLDTDNRDDSNRYGNRYRGQGRYGDGNSRYQPLQTDQDDKPASDREDDRLPSDDEDNHQGYSKSNDDKWEGHDDKDDSGTPNASDTGQEASKSRTNEESTKEDWYGRHQKQPDEDDSQNKVPVGGGRVIPDDEDYNNRNEYQDYNGNYYDRNPFRGYPNRFPNYRFPNYRYPGLGDYQDYVDYTRPGNNRIPPGRGRGGPAGGQGRGNWSPSQNRYDGEENRGGQRVEDNDDSNASQEEMDIPKDQIQGDAHNHGDPNSADVPHSRRLRPGLWKIWRYMYGSSAQDYTTEYPRVDPDESNNRVEEGGDEKQEEEEDEGNNVDDSDSDVKVPSTDAARVSNQGNGDTTSKPLVAHQSNAPDQASQDQRNNSATHEAKDVPKTPSSGEHSEVRVVEKQGVTATAVLPLTIGLFLTLFLLLMMSCRLRYMNRRLRYGRLKTNNAHDADYLINGMYL